MNQQLTVKTKFLLVPILVLSAAPSKLIAGGGFSTVTASGNTTNANQFESKCSVYLSMSGKKSGFADGDYYFQVTDTNGDTLLSTDPVSNRRFRISGGFITAFTGTGGQPHPTSPDSNNLSAGALTLGLANGGCPNDFISKHRRLCGIVGVCHSFSQRTEFSPAQLALSINPVRKANYL